MTALIDRAAQAASRRARALVAEGAIPGAPTAADLEALAHQEACALAEDWMARGICTRRRGYDIILRNAPLCFLVDVHNSDCVPRAVAKEALHLHHERIERERRAALGETRGGRNMTASVSGYRRRSRWYDYDDKHQSCACVGGGLYLWTRRQHRAYHTLWEEGIPLPAALRQGPLWGGTQPLVVVTEESPAAAHRVVYNLARLFQREGHFDFVGWPSSKRFWDIPKADSTAALVAVRDGRAVGLCIVLNKEARERHEGHKEIIRRPTLDIIFVCHGWRRQGIGQELARAACAYFGVRPGELVWSWPLSDAGEALLHATLRASGDDPWWVTYKIEEASPPENAHADR